MEHTKIPYIAVSYPIGYNIPNLLLLVDTYVDAFNQIKPHENTRINLWCRGSSGAMIAALFASKINHTFLYIAHVKKQGETSHMSAVYYPDNCYNIIIDDFISTGETVKAIIDHVHEKVDTTDKLDLLIVASGALDTTFAEDFKKIISND